MANKIIGVLGVSLLLVSLFSWATPVSAGKLAWSAESIPGTAGVVLGPAGIDVRDIAVAADGKSIYAVPGDSVSDNVVYKSNAAGVSWTRTAAPGVSESGSARAGGETTSHVALRRTVPPGPVRKRKPSDHA